MSSHRVAIMQPYFLPYIGYWQLAAAVDTFIVYDNIQYTKKGWMTRNRFLLNGRDEKFSLSLKKESDMLDVRERELAETFERDKLLRQLREAYRKAPYFSAHFPVIEEIILSAEQNLFAYLLQSIEKMTAFLDIKTKLVVSSTLGEEHRALRGQDKVLSLCKAVGATHYINPIGGTELYDPVVFQENGIDLSFLKTGEVVYPQFGNEFIHYLSILDVLMFNEIDKVKSYLKCFGLEKNG